MPYFSLSEVLERSGVSRQTLWRWRRQGRVPAGHRLRDGQVLFTPAEVEAVLAYRDHFQVPPVPLVQDPAPGSLQGAPV